MRLSLLLLCLSAVAFAPLQPSEAGIILDRIGSVISSLVPARWRPTTESPIVESAEDPVSGEALLVTSAANVTANATDASLNGTDSTTKPSLSKGFIDAPRLSKCGSGFRQGHNGRCYRIV